ncbi:MAG TPA: VOC family protein [Terriglobia bacterium]|nr:VOC family protein [Terriglobia bacterium]
MTRRELLFSIPALAAAPRVFGQAAKPPLAVKTINHFGLMVSDVKKSVDFYQSLFGMPIQARQGSTVIMRIGGGPQFLALSPASGAPGIVANLGLGVDNFNPDRAIETLMQHGLSKAAESDPGLSGGAMKMRVGRRGADKGGAKDGTPELFVGDPDGFIVQLQDTKYCGGAGALGEICSTVEAAPKKGLLAVKDLSHFTIATADANRSNTFYQTVFGLPIRSRQGPIGTTQGAPGLGIGPGVGFIMFMGGAGGRGRGGAAPAANVNHVCMNMENFNPDEIMKTLAGFGITERAGQGATPPMRSYISMRMPNRGGAPEGTPELYFTDPDGLLLQLQDVKYCGGAGFLGNECLG